MKCIGKKDGVFEFDEEVYKLYEITDAAFNEFVEELMSSQNDLKKRTAYFSIKKNLQEFVNSFPTEESLLKLLYLIVMIGLKNGQYRFTT